VRRAAPGTRVVLYSGFEEQGLADQARSLGASGFIQKGTPVGALVDRLLEVLDTDDRSGCDSEPENQSGVPGAPPPESNRASTADQSVLDEHLERFRQVFEEAAIGMATMTLAGTLVRANGTLAAVVQRSADQLVGMGYGQLTDGREADVAAALEQIRREPLDVVQLEHGISGRPGRLVRTTFAPVRDSEGRALYIFVQAEDVTAERAALEASRRSEERFRLLVEAVKDYAIFMLTPEGLVDSWNPGAQRSKGYAAEEIIGQHFRIFYPPEQQRIRHPEHELELALRDGQYAEEGWRIRKDGSTFWASVVITAVFDDQGRHIGFAKVTRDNSERRELEVEREEAVAALASANAELESLNARLQQAADDQAQFLAVTAHELRTPIGVLGGSAEMLAEYWPELDQDERSELLRGIGSSTARLRRLLDDLLTASRLQASALTIGTGRVSVADVVEDAVATVRRTAPGVQVLVDLVPPVQVEGDRDRLAQALDNLIGNALLHGKPPVRISVATDASTVLLRVSDQGAGVAAEVRPRLFERFATGLSKGGTGLGLFIVRELARSHGGDAFYEPATDAAGAGAFVISLPRIPLGLPQKGMSGGAQPAYRPSLDG
jgi:PAS domain S-box-containing protein